MRAEVLEAPRLVPVSVVRRPGGAEVSRGPLAPPALLALEAGRELDALPRAALAIWFEEAVAAEEEEEGAGPGGRQEDDS